MQRFALAFSALLFLALPEQAAAGDWDDCKQEQNRDQAISGCTRIIESGVRVGREVAFRNRGLAYANKGDHQRAIADYTQSLAVEPSYADSYNSRGYSYHETGDYDRAIADLDQAIRLRSNFSLAYLNRGRAYHEKGDYDRAIADYDLAIRHDSRSAMAYNNRCYSLHEKGQYDRAIADCDQAIRLDPNYAFPYNNRGRTYQAKGDIERAMSDYEQATRIDPNYATPYVNRGYILQERGEFDRAITEYDQAIRLAPKFALAYNNRGNAYFSKRDFNKSFADHDQAIRLDPKFAMAWRNRGLDYFNKNDLDRALADFEQSIRLSPNYADAYNSRGYTHYRKRNFDRAIADFSQAIALNPGFALAYNNRGEVYSQKGDPSRALADFNEAVRLSPDYAEAHYNRTQLLSRHKNLDKTLAARNEPPKIEPSVPAVDDKSREAATGLNLLAEKVAPPVVQPERQDMPARPVASMGRRVALVIGNSNYRQVSHLPNPRNDAEAVASGLQRVGFDVMARYDLGVEDMRRALAAFEDKAAGSDWGLVYYAGHGMEFNGRNWLIPVDARLDKLNDVPDETISLDRVLDRVNAARKLRIVILDACRNNPFPAQMASSGRSRAVQRGLADIEPEHGEVVFYAARHGTTADDGLEESKHSPFTAALLKHMNEDGLELGRFFRRVTSTVLASTSPKQEPFVYGRLPDEDFFFIPPK